ncbi:MAG TPA: S-layer homology domain-containing protein [Symbiobacteriaceae bacterium]|nr:S-layer homology domain-containing protein [Symbiobacteriaceae bacterium]
MKRFWVWALLVCGVLTVSAAPAYAGAPRRYVDRSEWPRWAATYYTSTSETPNDGELVDAIRFELIRGYPVAAQDLLGYEDRVFMPNRAMTRGEFAAVLSRSQALATEDGQGAEWYKPYVDALKAKGIIPADASEAWGEKISRREAGQWMGRAAEAFHADDRPPGIVFSDVDDPVIQRALRAGIVKGTGEGRFEPDRELLRVEAAVMLVRLARGRNAEGNANNPEVIEALKGVVLEADRQGTVQGKRWVQQEYLDPVETGGVLTQEFAQFLDFTAADNLEVRNTAPRAWYERIPEKYRFEVLEVHDATAVLQVCGTEQYYRLSDPSGSPWFQQNFCERQYMISTLGSWLISSAADPIYH